MRKGENNIVHLFHWPAYRGYQERLLRVLALPFGAKGELPYPERWANPTFKSIAIGSTVRGMNAILWVLSRRTSGSNKLDFHFACPVRLLEIMSVELKDGDYRIHFLSKEFPKEFTKVNEIQQLENETGIEFCKNQIPHPGSGEYGSLVHVVRMNIGRIFANARTELQLETLYEVLKDILYDPSNTPPVKMDAYPLLELSGIGNSKPNNDGLYELSLKRNYKLPFSWYQAEEHRNRDIYINESRYVGKRGDGEILVREANANGSEVSVEVKFDSSIFRILVPVLIKKIPWLRKFAPVIVLFVISILLVIGNILIAKCWSGSQPALTIAIPLLVIVLSKFYEVMTKKD